MMIGFKELLQEAADSWKTPPAPPKQASPVEIKRVLFIRIPKYKLDLQKAMKKLEKAKTDAQIKNAKENIEIKKGKLDFQLARLSLLLDYATENTLTNPKVSDEVKAEVKKLVGKGAPVISDAEGYAAAAAGQAGLSTAPLHGSFAGKYDAMIAGDPEAFAGDVDMPKKAVPYVFEKPGSTPAPASEPAATTSEPIPDPVLPPAPLKSFNKAQEAQLKGLVRATAAKAAKEGTFQIDLAGVKKAAQEMGNFDTIWLDDQLATFEGGLWVKEPTDAQNDAIKSAAQKLLKQNPESGLMALAEAALLDHASKTGEFITMSMTIPVVSKVMEDAKPKTVPFADMNIGEKNKVLKAAKLATVANAWAQTIEDMGGPKQTQKSSDQIASDLAQGGVPVDPADLANIMSNSANQVTELVSGPLYNALVTAADKSYQIQKKSGIKPTAVSLAVAMAGVGVGHMTATSVNKVFNDLAEQHEGPKEDMGGLLTYLDTKIGSFPTSLPVPAKPHVLIAGLPDWDATKANYGFAGKEPIKEKTADYKHVETSLRDMILKRQDLNAGKNIIIDHLNTSFEQGNLNLPGSFVILSHLGQKLGEQAGLWADNFSVGIPDKSLTNWIGEVIQEWKKQKENLPVSALPAAVLTKMAGTYTTGFLPFEHAEKAKTHIESAVQKATDFIADKAAADQLLPSDVDFVAEKVVKMVPGMDLANAKVMIHKAKIAKFVMKWFNLGNTYDDLTDLDFNNWSKKTGESMDETKAFVKEIADKFAKPAPAVVPSQDVNPVPGGGTVDLSTIKPPKNTSLGYTKKELQPVHMTYLKATAISMFQAQPWANQFMPPKDNKKNFMVTQFRSKFQAEFGYPIKLGVAHKLLKQYYTEHNNISPAKDEPNPIPVTSLKPGKKTLEGAAGLDQIALDKIFDIHQTPAGFGEIPTTFPGQKGGGIKSGATAQLAGGITALWKKNSVAGVNFGEVAANRLQTVLGIHGSPMILHKRGKQLGVLTKYPSSEKPLGSDTGGGDQWSLSPTYPKAFQKALFMDMLTYNNDSHPGNFIKLPNGDLKPIDFGQAMKFFDSGKLIDLDYKVVGGYHSGSPKGVPHRMIQAWANGQDVNLSALTDPDIMSLFDKVEAIPSESYKQLWRPAAEAMKKHTGAETLAGFSKTASDKQVESFLENVDQKRKDLRRDMGRFYLQAAIRRSKKTGENPAGLALSSGAAVVLAGAMTDSSVFAEAVAGIAGAKAKAEAAIKAAMKDKTGPGWQVEGKHIGQWVLDALEPVPDVPEDNPTPSKDGDPNEILPTSHTPTVAKLKERTGMGVQEFFAGAGADGIVERGRIAMYRSDEGRVFAHLILSTKGRQKVAAKLKKIPTVVGGTVVDPGPQLEKGPIETANDEIRQKVITEGAIAKLASYANDDPGAFSNLSTVRKAYKEAGILKDSDDPKIAAMAKHYFDQLDPMILKVPSTGGEGKDGVKWKLDPDLPPEKRKLVPWEPAEEKAEKEAMLKKLEADKAAWKKKQEEVKNKPATVKATQVNYFPTFNNTPNTTPKSNMSQIEVDSGFQSKGGFINGGSGSGHIVDMGGGMSVAVAGSDVPYSRKGTVLVEFPPNTTDEDIKGGFEKLKGLGLDFKPATRADTEVEYLRQMAWLFRRAGSGEDDGLDKKEPKNVSSQELADWYVSELAQAKKKIGGGYGGHRPSVKYTGGIGQDIRKMGGYDPIPKDFGGRLEFRKADADDETMKKLEGYLLTNSASTSSAVMPVLTGQFLSYDERYQKGVRVTGQSNYQDMNTGGATQTFWRLRKKAGVGSGFSVAIEGTRLGYTGCYGTTTDSYGAQKASGGSQDPRYRPPSLAEEREVDEHLSASLTEVMIAGGVRLDDWLYKTGFGTWAPTVKKKLKEKGITTFNGKPVDDVIA